ncbi:MAG: hypothetical protein IJX39_02520 [Clostridia bacterium]|nr:hypothetical protein [Clostridia bacterium]
MKKRKICILLILLVAVLLLGTGIFFLITKGVAEEKDGLLQNSRIYMTDVYYENGEVHYTIVNDTYLKFYRTEFWPDVQKKSGDSWVDVQFHGTGFEIRTTVYPFSEDGGRFGVINEFDKEELIGEYRLVHGIVDPNDIHIVGYFTITEDMLE